MARIHAPALPWPRVVVGLLASSCDGEPASAVARDVGPLRDPVGTRAIAEDGNPDEDPDALGPSTAMACDGTPLPMCASGWTGPSCDLRCEGEGCGFATYCHGDGRTWGLASFGAKLFPASASLPDDALHARFEGFVVEHPEAVGLAPGVSPQDLDLVPAQGFRAPAGKIVLLRFDQRYREIPVYGPDGTVRVTLAPGGAIAFDGAIVDGREVWANLDQQASEDVARRSILVHAAERSGRPAEALEVAGLRQVAVPRVQRIGWVGTVRGPGFAWASMLLLGLVGARRRGHRRRDGVTAMLALMLAGSSIHGCCDSAVATEASLTSESSTTSDSSASESTGEPGLPLWALGVFSDQTNRVGTTIDNPLWYVWSNIEITASGSMIYDQYVCSTPRERQEFRWTLAADRQSLSLQPVPPSELFTFGSDDFISEVIIEPGDSCDAIAIRYFSRDAMQWFEAEYLRGEVCAEPTDPDGCAFTFEWCDGVPPTACE